MVYWIHRIPGIASLAPMPETTMNLPHCVAFFIKPVGEIFTDTFLPLVTSMTDAYVVLLGYPVQHFHRNYRVSVLWLVATGRNDRDCVLLEESFSEDKVAGRGNGQTGCERVNVGDLTEQFTKLKTATSKNVHIRLAVPKNFSREIELVLMFHHVFVPCKEFLAVIGAHTVRVIILGIRHWPHIILIPQVEESIGDLWDGHTFGTWNISPCRSDDHDRVTTGWHDLHFTKERHNALDGPSPSLWRLKHSSLFAVAAMFPLNDGTVLCVTQLV